MKRYIKIFILVFSLSFLWGCLEDPEVYKVTVKTDSIVEFVQGGVSVSGGIYTENEGYQPTIESSGFCYGLAVGPTLSNFVVKVKKSGIGDFNATLKSLDEGTKYYVRAFAQNKYGVVYGEEVSFVSLTKPTVKTLSLSENNENSQLIVNCELESLGSGDITELGVCYSTEKKLPNKDNDEYKLVSNIQKGKYTVSILVEPNVKYYIRAFASNLAGVAYGEVKEILTTEAIYTIKFDGNGGVGSMEEIYTTPSKEVQLISNSFTRIGYTFIGWNTEVDGSGTTYYNEQNISIDSDLTLYAQWTPIYTITFNANGGSGSMSSETVSSGSSVSLPANTFTRSGYEFVGWNTNADGYGVPYTNGQRITPSRNITLYAQWKKNEVYYTISFNSNGGSGTMYSTEVQEGVNYTLPANTFSRTGYTFIGWNTNVNGNGTSYNDKHTIMVRGNLTLYAQWKKIEEDQEHVSGSHQGHDYVDLGLPSGTLWATCNVGASRPEGYGDYFAWGETETKENYYWETYKWCEGTEDTQIKYCTNSAYGIVDNKTILELADDVAHVNWGGNWRIPTEEEQDELQTKCTWVWGENNGVNGYFVKGNNGNSIFLPAAGIRFMYGSLYTNTEGQYWNTSISTPNGSSYLQFNSNYIFLSPSYRYCGFSVRPVIKFSYNVTFDSNGGEGSMQSIVIEEIKQIVIPSNKFTRVGYYFDGWNTKADGSGVPYTNGQRITPSRNITLYAQWKKIEEEQEQVSGSHMGHNYVDLGLPSGTLWATCNVGASKPEEYGDYFAWGETSTKFTYTASNYTFTDYETTLSLRNDAANVNWGGEWHTPKRKELNELSNSSYTIWTWVNQNGVEGYKVVSRSNGNSIFLPAAGSRDGSDLNYAGTNGNYWSSTITTGYSHYAEGLGFKSSNVWEFAGNRYSGKTIRPIMSK